MKHFLVFLTLFFANVCSFAQQIAGKVLDEFKEPLPYVDVVALSLPDSLMIEGTITDNDGNFILSKTENTEFVIRISMVGYKSVWFDKIQADLGIIVMLAESER